jgi:hypothetical protein
MLTEEQRRIAEQGLSQNERVGRDRMARFPDQPQPAIQLPNYAPGGKFSRGSGSIEYTTDMGMPANPYRDRLARLPDLSHPALRQQFQGNNSADAQPIQGNNRPVFDVSGPIRAGGSGSMVMRPVPPDQMQDNNPSQTYQNQENRSFSNSYGNSYNNSMSGYQPQYGSRGGFGMQQPMYGGGMGIMGLQSPLVDMECNPLLVVMAVDATIYAVECNNLCMVVCSKDMECSLHTVDMECNSLSTRAAHLALNLAVV